MRGVNPDTEETPVESSSPNIVWVLPDPVCPYENIVAAKEVYYEVFCWFLRILNA
jgi:hypothetical protein